jgi:hypothetical protein
MRFVPRSVAPWLAVVTLTLAGAAAAAGYAVTAPKRYEATAQLLVTAVPASDSTYTGLDLLRTGARRTAAASAAALLRSPQVADAVRAQLGLARSRDSLLASVDPHVVDESDVVAITVDDTSAAGAAQLANAFADALVSQRTASFQSQLATTIRRDEELLRTAKGGGARELERRLAVLRSLQGQPDPTLRSAGQASAPESAAWPKLPRLAGIGAGLGLVAGLLVALVLAVSRLLAARSAPGYDRRVPERVVEALEARLQEKIEALVAESERLAARDAALAQREREVTAKLEELRAVAPAGASAADDAGLAEREQELARRERDLEASRADLARREEALDEREQELAGGKEEDAELARRRTELEARVAALTQRELELARRAAALAVQEQEAVAAPADGDGELARRESELEARVAALTKRELELARRAAALAVQEQEAVAAPADGDGELARRESELEARVAGLTQRELELARRAAALAARERELEARPAPTPRPAALPRPEPGPRQVAAPPPPAAEADGAAGQWNLISLERLVDERGVDFPDRVDEWTSYLYFLREYAQTDGTIPASFDWLIQDTFAEIVA